MAPSQRRAALQKFSLRIGLSTAAVILLFALVAPVSLLGTLQLRLGIALAGGAVFLGALLISLPKKRRSRVTASKQQHSYSSLRS